MAFLPPKNVYRSSELCISIGAKFKAAKPNTGILILTVLATPFTALLTPLVMDFRKVFLIHTVLSWHLSSRYCHNLLYYSFVCPPSGNASTVTRTSLLISSEVVSVLGILYVLHSFCIRVILLTSSFIS